MLKRIRDNKQRVQETTLLSNMVEVVIDFDKLEDRHRKSVTPLRNSASSKRRSVDFGDSRTFDRSTNRDMVKSELLGTMTGQG